MRKRLVFLLTLCAALLCMALAEETTQLTVLPVTETVRPGKGVTLAYEAPEAGKACIQLVDDAGNTVLMIDPDRASTAGTNELIWNGTYEGWQEHVQFLRDFVLSEGSDRVATMVSSAQRAFGLSDEQMRSYFGALVQAE